MFLAIVGAVRGGKRIAHLQTERLGHARTDHAGEEIVVAEITPPREGERLAVATGELAEEVGIGADDAEAAVVVPHAGRHGHGGARRILPVDTIGPAGRGEKLLVKVPADVLNRLADEIDGVEHQLERASLGADDHVVAEPRSRLERPLHEASGDEGGHDQRHSEGQRQRRQRAGERPLSDVAPGDAEEVHGEDRGARGA